MGYHIVSLGDIFIVRFATARLDQKAFYSANIIKSDKVNDRCKNYIIWLSNIKCQL